LPSLCACKGQYKLYNATSVYYMPKACITGPKICVWASSIFDDVTWSLPGLCNDLRFLNIRFQKIVQIHYFFQ
jgi:hypothetical protein